MERAAIQGQCTYSTVSGALYYVHEIKGDRVIYCRVGSVIRNEASLGRFAAIAAQQVPNQ